MALSELEFLKASGGVGEQDVRRLRMGLGMSCVDEVVVIKDESCVEESCVVKDEVKDEVVEDYVEESYDSRLVSLKSILTPLIATDSSVTQLCRRVRPVLERKGFATFKRHKSVHVRRSDADRVLEVGRGVWAGLH